MNKKKISPELVNPKIPSYQREFYSWLYESPRLTRWMDSQRWQDVITFGSSSRLIKSCAAEVSPRSEVLQMGATFGRQIEAIAERIGVYGRFDLIDVSLTQLRRCRNKYCYRYPFMRFINADAAEPFKQQYDVILCYMLLHEVPVPTRRRIINNALNQIKPGGKVIFVDYNNSVIWHPLRFFIKLFNRLYQPFAEKMWNSEIRQYVDNPNQYYWRKTTFFGKMYQRVVATKKEGLY